MGWILTIVVGAVASDLGPERDALTDLVVGPVRRAAGVRAWCERKPGAPGTWILVERGGLVVVAVDDGGAPDRVALSPDGAHLAYVSAPTGLAGIYLLDLDDGEVHGITNMGLPRGKGGPPAGFVPVPWDDSLRFVGTDLVWSAADGEHRRTWTVEP